MLISNDNNEKNGGIAYPLSMKRGGRCGFLHGSATTWRIIKYTFIFITPAWVHGWSCSVVYTGSSVITAVPLNV
jgi:hypothetical protein